MQLENSFFKLKFSEFLVLKIARDKYGLFFEQNSKEFVDAKINCLHFAAVLVENNNELTHSQVNLFADIVIGEVFKKGSAFYPKISSFLFSIFAEMFKYNTNKSLTEFCGLDFKFIAQVLSENLIFTNKETNFQIIQIISLILSENKLDVSFIFSESNIVANLIQILILNSGIFLNICSFIFAKLARFKLYMNQLLSNSPFIEFISECLFENDQKKQDVLCLLYHLIVQMNSGEVCFFLDNHFSLFIILINYLNSASQIECLVYLGGIFQVLGNTFIESQIICQKRIEFIKLLKNQTAVSTIENLIENRDELIRNIFQDLKYQITEFE